jgi:hypothetical protein
MRPTRYDIARVLFVLAAAVLLFVALLFLGYNTSIYEDGSFRMLDGLVTGCIPDADCQDTVDFTEQDNVNWNMPPDDDVIVFEDGTWLSPLPGGGYETGCIRGGLCNYNACTRAMYDMLQVHQENDFLGVVMIMGDTVSVWMDGEMIASGEFEESCYE